MSQDSTSNAETQVEASENTNIVDQSTLEQVLAQEPVAAQEERPEENTQEEPSEPQLEKAEVPRKIFGRFDSEEQAEKSYKELQTAYQAIKKQLDDGQKAQQEAQFKNFESMDYEEQTKFLAQQVVTMQQQLAESQAAQQQLAQQQSLSADQEKMEEFISKNALLKESGMDDVFRILASQPEYREYSFDSIFKTLLQPKIEKLMGKKIKVREKPIAGAPKAEPKRKSVKDMSPREYEKNRPQILRELGVNI